MAGNLPFQIQVPLPLSTPPIENRTLQMQDLVLLLLCKELWETPLHIRDTPLLPLSPTPGRMHIRLEMERVIQAPVCMKMRVPLSHRFTQVRITTGLGVPQQNAMYRWVLKPIHTEETIRQVEPDTQSLLPYGFAKTENILSDLS